MKHVSPQRQNPYTRLRDEACIWIASVIGARRVAMFVYPEAKLRTLDWNLFDLSERTRAAQQLGFEVRLRYVDGEGLRAEYVAKLPDPPYWY